jgi:outer membrane receptor for ferrienterochelin and colicins
VVGSYGRIDGSVGVNTPIKNWKPSLNLSYRKYGGYDLNEKTISEDGTSYNKYQGQLNITGELSDELQLNLNTLFMDEEHIVRSSSIFEDHIINNHLASRAELSKKELMKNFNIKGGIEYSQYEHKYDQKVVSSGFYKEGDITNERLLRGDAFFDYSFGTNLLNGGYSVEYETIDSDRVLGSEQNSTLHNVFIQNEIEVNNWFTALGGIRLDAHSVYGSQLSPKVALMTKTSSTSRFRLSYAEGFRSPGFKELFIEYINLTVGYHIEGNPDLEPERSKSIQSDFEYWNNNNYHFRIHGFFNKINNLIDYEYRGIIDGYGTYRTQNLSRVNTWGGDLEVEFFPYDFLNCKFGYSYFDSWDSQTENSLTFKSKHKINFSFGLNFIETVSFNIRGQYFGEQFYWSDWDEISKTGNKESISDYLLLHTNVSYSILDNMSLYSGLRNLTDYINRTWGPMPGREWYAGIRYNFQ